MEIKIIFNNNRVGTVTSEPVDLATFINVVNTSILNFMNQVPLEAKPLAFDIYNESASALLATFMPDKDLRPDLTEEAIREMELKILDRHTNKDA